MTGLINANDALAEKPQTPCCIAQARRKDQERSFSFHAFKRGQLLQVVGARCLRDYTLQGQTATGGLNGIWRIYSARCRKEGGQSLARTAAYKYKRWQEEKHLLEVCERGHVR